MKTTMITKNPALILTAILIATLPFLAAANPNYRTQVRAVVYFYPDIDVYYLTSTSEYVYQLNGHWVYSRKMPACYPVSYTNRLTRYKVGYYGRNPFIEHRRHITRFNGCDRDYRNYRFDERREHFRNNKWDNHRDTRDHKKWESRHDDHRYKHDHEKSRQNHRHRD